MALRTCAKCQAADNPLGRLRFKKNPLDGKVYCENCSPNRMGGEAEAPASFAPTVKPSAGYVVIPCPACAGGFHRPHRLPCVSCSGYGAVRMEASMLNVYRPKQTTEPSILTEEAPPPQSQP